jgi:D-alanyl-D-alanine dipeptidase
VPDDLNQRLPFSYRALLLHISNGAAALLVFAFLYPGLAGLRAQSQSSFLPGPQPPDVPAEWKQWIGEYGADRDLHSVFERKGKLWLSIKGKGLWLIEQNSPGQFSVVDTANSDLEELSIGRGSTGILYLGISDVRFRLRTFGADDPLSSKVATQGRIDELRKEALALQPPNEKGSFRAPDLVELAPLAPSIHLDIRYATSNDFLGTAVYSQARAFLQRPAADAILRVQKKLNPHGYGLLIHDAYRPWYVTKIFWDATPPEGKIFVADPAQGSRHNRGCAVDLTLYDLTTGRPVEMPGTYDEMSPRSFPDYPGGTSLQRWHRDLLRRAMESEGFTVYESEWWHFDYKDWPEYPILNVPFEKLGSGHESSAVH